MQGSDLQAGRELLEGRRPRHESHVPDEGRGDGGAFRAGLGIQVDR